jgi:hypothetical protein
MNFNVEVSGAIYAIVSSGFTVKLLFGEGCGDSLVYDDSLAVKRLENLMPGFSYGLNLFKKIGGQQYKYHHQKREFIPIEKN